MAVSLCWSFLAEEMPQNCFRSFLVQAVSYRWPFPTEGRFLWQAVSYAWPTTPLLLYTQGGEAFHLSKLFSSLLTPLKHFVWLSHCCV